MPGRRRDGERRAERQRGSLARLVWYVAHVGCIRMRREKTHLVSQSDRQTKSVSEGVSEGGWEGREARAG